VAIDLFPFLRANNAQVAQLAGGLGNLQGAANAINSVLGKNVVNVGGISYALIGGLKGVKVGQKRENGERRRIGRPAYRPWQRLPGNITVTISAKIVELYDLQQVAGLLGIPPAYLLHQQFALTLLKEKRDPKGGMVTTIYSDVWFSEDSEEIALDEQADQLVTHDITFDVGAVFVADNTGAGSGPEIDADAAISLAGSGVNKALTSLGLDGFELPD
jgi:hypothetical protein